MKLPVTCKFDIVIAGGGAAGLAAAVKAGLLAKSPEAPSALRIALIEKKEVPGKKLSATGNGRCNLANKDAYGCWDVLFLFEEIGKICDILLAVVEGGDHRQSENDVCAYGEEGLEI